MSRKFAVSVFAVLMAVVMSGCATAPKGPSDEELVQQAVQGFTAAAAAKDVNKMMSYLSPNFASDEWADKDAYQTFVNDAIDMGYLDDMEATLDTAKTTIEGGKATVYPIELQTAAGSATIEAVFSKENGAWLITAMSMEQY